MSEITCNYDDLCQRNPGIFTEEEQQLIRQARVAMIGCGGIGGVVAIVLARCAAPTRLPDSTGKVSEHVLVASMSRG